MSATCGTPLLGFGLTSFGRSRRRAVRSWRRGSSWRSWPARRPRALVSCELSGPVDEAERLFQRNLNLQAKVDEAADLPLRSERETVAVLNLKTEQLRLGLAKAELAEKCARRGSDTS